MKNKIIKTASALFTEHGVDKTSLAEIALKAEISKGTLYYHFPTKNDLVFAVSEMHMQALTDGLFEFLKSNKNTEDIISELYRTIPRAMTRSRLHIYLLREAVTDSPELKEKFHNIYKKWQSMLQEAILELFPGISDPEAVSAFIVASVDGLVIQNLLDIEKVPTKRFVSLIQSVLTGN